jgi:hypothetical protein
MSRVTISNVLRFLNLTNIKNGTTKNVEGVSYKNLNIQNILIGSLSSVIALTSSAAVTDIKPQALNIETAGYPKSTVVTSILPFRLTITNIGVESYRPDNPPGIGVQVIEFSNYIL